MKALFWTIRRASLCTSIPGGARARNFTSAVQNGRTSAQHRRAALYPRIFEVTGAQPGFQRSVVAVTLPEVIPPDFGVAS